ncbi:MAG: hypothetical protein K2L76_03740 [Muribaculaceae bacterium]|nr:hypothetical protein [Muribaculaceae bacterium]
MNKTVTLPEIAAHTALAASSDSDTATRFIVGLFAAVESSLAADGTATVKGIGTWRRDAAAPGGVGFTPDKALADAVNAPFSAFAPIALPADAPADIFDEETAEAEAGIPEAEAVPAAEPEPEADTTEAETETAEETVAEPEPETVAEQEPESVPEPQPEVSPEEDAEPERVCAPRRSAWPWIAAVAMLVVGFAAGYFAGSRNSVPDVAEPPADTLVAVAATPDTMAVAAAVPAAEPDTVAEPDTIAEPEPEPQQKEPVYDTVTSTRFLTTIARDHYGRKDFWVFIYEANADKLRHPNRIRPGTRILIPDLGEHAALDPATRRRAHELATEIYNRYDMN